MNFLVCFVTVLKKKRFVPPWVKRRGNTLICTVYLGYCYCTVLKNNTIPLSVMIQ